MIDATKAKAIVEFCSGDYRAQLKQIDDIRKNLPNVTVSPTLDVVLYTTSKGNVKLKLVGTDDRYPITMDREALELLTEPHVAAFIAERMKSV